MVNLESLIYCNSESKCEVSDKNNGYFINSFNYEVIKCHQSKCTLINTNSYCSSYSNEVILNNNVLYYCNGNNIISFSDDTMYYILDDINANSIYPVIESGTDTIIIMIDKYSVTQLIKKKICLKSNLEIPLCNSSDITIYSCTSASKSCIILENTCDPLDPTELCNGYYLINVNEETNEGDLYKCLSGECTIQNNPTKGYYKVTDSTFKSVDYISCDGNKCKRIMITELETSSSIPGTLFYDDNIYLHTDSDYSIIPFQNFRDDIYYFSFVKNVDNNIFGTKENGDYVMIRVTEDSCVLADSSISKNYIKKNQYIKNF
ncbi:hypothetical protein BCR32DRAFT_282235 [Anaeromyces robustus]|uniref:Scaffoldin n=1 Tax=Anaeromyces robustus TaxID=1754192 RepID=A0A1Y1WYR2_9FUNG|nr:hypothetical protein BCR32DRAFT_282235 [Anaeromyces robustus]|eukprot:ORX78488.1 hypothetical protein BCR32DRAFT_282235 [Anaeromyces robustus]